MGNLTPQLALELTERAMTRAMTKDEAIAFMCGCASGAIMLEGQGLTCIEIELETAEIVRELRQPVKAVK